MEGGNGSDSIPQFLMRCKANNSPPHQPGKPEHGEGKTPSSPHSSPEQNCGFVRCDLVVLAAEEGSLNGCRAQEKCPSVRLLSKQAWLEVGG